jgi:ribokinase
VTVVVVGQVARDLVLRVDDVPEPGGSVLADERYELLGGKGANIAVGLAQLAVPVALVGVVGDDAAGRDVLAQADADGMDTRGVVVRAGGTTALLLDLTDGRGTRRLVEHVPGEVLLTEQDVVAASEVLAGASTLVLQLQQPAAALLAAARAAGAGARVVLDGAPEAEVDALLAAAAVLRADAHEGELLVGHPVDSVEAGLAAARGLLDRGPALVALEVAGAANVLVWSGGESVEPFGDVDVTDPTGGGDSFVAGLVAALEGGARPEEAGRRATAAAAGTVARLGGRPRLCGS